MSVQTYKYETDATAASKDLQDVTTTVVINYHLDPAMASDVYRDYREEYIDRLAAPAVQETVKQVTARYIAEDLILRRELVKADIQNAMMTRLGPEGVIVEQVSITEFTFSPRFTEAIEAKVAAEQAILEALNNLERIKVEAQSAEAEAVGKANARIAQAEGEAEYIRIVTAAQVSANEAIDASLNDRILEYILYSRFGENVTLYILPGGTDIVVPTP